MKTPRCHACCEEKEQHSRQRPQWCRYRDLNLLVPCRRPRRPRMRRAGQARHFSCKIPLALTRLQCDTRTASTLDAGLCAGSSRHLRWSGFRGVEHPSSPRRVARLLRVVDGLPTGSFGSRQIMWPMATSFMFTILSRHSAQQNGEPPPIGGSQLRAQEKYGDHGSVSA